MALVQYFAMAIFIWIALFLGFGKIPPKEIDRRKLACSTFDLSYKPKKKKRKNSDQWGKRYFKQQ